jgi:hypothetical protein
MNALFHRGHALLIGVGGNLPCTIRDVEGLRDILVNPERCAYPPDQVRLLTEENASVANIRGELKRLAKVIEKDKRGSTVIVYFSGHGGYVQSREGEAYSLVASGCGRNESQETTMRGTEFTVLLEDIRAERLLLVLDCCHAGGIELPLAKGVAYKELSPQVRTILAGKQGRVVLASSTGAELSWTGKPYSAFTHSLLEALCGEGNPRRDGFVRVSDLVNYTSEQVPRKTNDRQHPTFDFKSDNFEIAYYGGGDTKVKSLPFASFKPDPTGEKSSDEDEIVTGDIFEGNEGPIVRTGIKLSKLPRRSIKVRTGDKFKNNKNKIVSTGIEINPGQSRRSTSPKRNDHGE